MTTTDKPSQEFWLKHIKDWQSSNLSQADYYQQHNIIVHRFGYCKRLLLKWFNRRGGKKRMTWQKFVKILESYRFPRKESFKTFSVL